jgi:sialic acid synthase SpsE
MIERSMNANDKHEAMSHEEFRRLVHGHEKLLEAIGKL